MTTTPMSITEMVAHISRNYPLRPFLYEVRIMGGGSVISDATLDITMNCCAVSVPGNNVSFNSIKKYGIGNMHQMPAGRSFTELNLTFYESDGEPERKYFADWQDRIYNRQTKRFGFYKDVIKTISILQYDKKGNLTYECQCLEAWPSNIGTLDKGYANEGIAQFSVNFQFYELNEISYDKTNGSNPFAGPTLSSLVGLL